MIFELLERIYTNEERILIQYNQRETVTSFYLIIIFSTNIHLNEWRLVD